MNLKTKIAIGFSLLLALSACRPDDDVSVIPELFYRDFQVIQNPQGLDSLAIWSLGFTDGDGDIGFRENSADTNNFIVRGFKTLNGVEEEIPNIANYSIPVVQNVNTANGIEGEFKFRIELSLYQDRGFDTLRLEGYVQDRAFNNSNSISTPFIKLN